MKTFHFKALKNWSLVVIAKYGNYVSPRPPGSGMRFTYVLETFHQFHLFQFSDTFRDFEDLQRYFHLTTAVVRPGAPGPHPVRLVGFSVAWRRERRL